MDVTLFPEKPYYSKTGIQGGALCEISIFGLPGFTVPRDKSTCGSSQPDADTKQR